MKQLRDANEIDAFAPSDEADPPAIPWPDELPPAGIYPGVAFDQYRAWPAVNASVLKHGYYASPLHMRAAMDGVYGTADSEARKFGRAVHCRLLEPERFKTSFLIAGTCCEPLKTGPRKGQPCGKQASHYLDGKWFCGTHATMEAATPGDYISQDEAARIEAIVGAVQRHKVVKLIRQHGGCEVSLVWSLYGVPCKARLDKLITGANCPDTIIDVKKCQAGSATEDAIQKSVRDYAWDMQASWYVDGVAAVLGKAPTFLWLFVEDSPPHDVVVVRASGSMLALGRAKYRRAIERYTWCLRANYWPGYADDIIDVEPSDWEVKRYGLGG